jgi:hypothetical protein
MTLMWSSGRFRSGCIQKRVHSEEGAGGETLLLFLNVSRKTDNLHSSLVFCPLKHAFIIIII